MVHHHKVDKAVIIPVHGHRSCAPLGDKFPWSRFPPVPFRCRAVPFHSTSTGRGASRERKSSARYCGAIYPAAYRIDYDVLKAVRIPVSRSQHRISPFRFGRSLDRTVAAGHGPEYGAVDLEQARSFPGRGFIASAVPYEGYFSGRIAGNEVRNPVTVPIRCMRVDRAPNFTISAS